jgi:Cu+-exporting ATPase
LGVRYKISVLSGDTAREKHGLMQVWNGFQQVFFGQTPEDKKNRISELSQKGDVVMMVGDGLNDAGALMSSDVGVVIAENASQFTPAAKGIIMSEKLPELNRMLRLCVKTLQTIRISFGISLMYNLVGLYFAVQGQLSPVIAAILMPLSSITVVLFNTFYTNYMAHKLKLR